MSFSSSLQEAEKSLGEGNAQEAFAELHPHLGYGVELSTLELSRAAGLLSKIMNSLDEPDVSACLHELSEHPEDEESLLEAGVALLDGGLSGIAANLLARALKLNPDSEGTVVALAGALEQQGLNDEACQYLREFSGLQESYAARFLLIFNTLLCGDWKTAVASAEQLAREETPDEQMQAAFGFLQSTLARTQTTAGCSSLSPTDLRGWHYALTGGVLLHLSPYGEDAGMNGRYAWFQDSEEHVAEGMARLEAVLRAWDAWPERIWILPEPNSASLAYGLSRKWNLPAEKWDGSSGPGLIVAYDLDLLDEELLERLIERHPRQLLWTHACCWAGEPPFAADFCTYLYQINTSPWEEGLKFDLESGQAGTTEEDSRPPSERGTGLAAIKPGEEALEDLPELLRFVKCIGSASVNSSGLRMRQPAGSPVKSGGF